MKGKKIFRNCIGALALLLGLAGCQNSLEGDSVSGGGIEGLRTLTVEIKNYSEFVEESSVQANMFAPARSIMPDAFKTGDSLNYYLYGTASNGEVHEWTHVKEVTGGKFTLDVEPYNWNLTLAVTADAKTTITEEDDLAAVKGKAVLIGYAAVDLTRHANSASFTLKPDGLTTPGQVNLTTSLDGWTIPASIEKVTLGIYNLTNGTEVTYSDGNSTVVTVKKSAGTTIAFPSTFGDESKDLAPGTYTFKVEFLNAEGEFAEWSDSLVILPGKTNGTAVAIPNVIGTAPAAATDFTASYVEKTIDRTPGFYDVMFEWKGDACINERSFEIDLLDVTGSTVDAIPDNKDPDKDKKWDAAHPRTQNQ